MKKILVVLIVVVMVLAIAAPVMAHPKGPSSMPAQSLGGLHTAVFNVPGDNPPFDSPKAYHVVRGLMILTGVEAPHPPCE